MIYKKYGSTGIDVSVIGFGGMRFEDPNDIEAEYDELDYDPVESNWRYA